MNPLYTSAVIWTHFSVVKPDSRPCGEGALLEESASLVHSPPGGDVGIKPKSTYPVFLADLSDI